MRHMHCNVLCTEPRNEKCLIKGLGSIKGLRSMSQTDDVTMLLNLVVKPEIVMM